MTGHLWRRVNSAYVRGAVFGGIVVALVGYAYLMDPMVMDKYERQQLEAAVMQLMQMCRPGLGS